MSRKDRLYQELEGPVPPFEFDAAVSDVFPDMIRRSVPGYATTVSTIGVLADQYARVNTRCYDLGCSLGAATLAMRHSISADGVEIIAVDNSSAMVDRCRAMLERDAGRVPVTVMESDILDLAMARASVVVLNFTLQFIPPQRRLELLRNIHNALLPGGVLLLSEKVCFEDAQTQQLMDQLHARFKQQQGYSELEIARKRAALENVLIADSLPTHAARLREAGFARSQCWFQCFNFASLIAFRGDD